MGKGIVNRGVLVLLIICSPVLSSLYGNSLYLKRIVEPAEAGLSLGDLFHGEAGRSSTLKRPLPPLWLEGDSILFISARGVEELLAEAAYAASVVGRGVWILPSTVIADEEGLEAILEGISSANDLLSRGFLLGMQDFQALQGSDAPYRFLRAPDGIALLQQSSGRKLATLTPLSKERQVNVMEAAQISAGTRLNVLISSRGMVIRAEGIANRSAKVGDRIPVTLTSTRRRVEATIIELDLAEVRL